MLKTGREGGRGERGVCNECNLLSRIKIFLLMFLIYDMTSIYKQNIFLQTSSVHNQMIISTRVGTQQRLCTTRDLNHFSCPQCWRMFLTTALIRWACRPTSHLQRTVCPWSALTTTCTSITAPSTSQPSVSSTSMSSSELTGPSWYQRQRGNIFIDNSRYNFLLLWSNLK